MDFNFYFLFNFNFYIGIYECLHLIKKSLQIKEFVKRSAKIQPNIEGKTSLEVEKLVKICSNIKKINYFILILNLIIKIINFFCI